MSNDALLKELRTRVLRLKSKASCSHMEAAMQELLDEIEEGWTEGLTEPCGQTGAGGGQMSMECGEVVAAIADSHYTDTKRAEAFYETCGEQLGGFTGVWLFLRDVAVIFDKAINEHWEEDEGDYIAAVSAYTHLIVEDAISHPDAIKDGGHRDGWAEKRALEALSENRWEENA